MTRELGPFIAGCLGSSLLFLGCIPEAALEDGLGDGSSGAAEDGGEEGSEDGGTASAPNGAAYPRGLAVASPTAAAGGSNAPGAPERPEGLAWRALEAAAGEAASSLTTGRRTDYAEVRSGRSFEEKQAELASIIAGTTAEACAVQFASLGMGGFNPECYGPTLDYQGHPDALAGQMDSGQLPGGDLGLWSATEASGEACAAAKLNSLIDDAGLRADFGLYTAASMMCTMNINGMALPEVGESIELETELTEVLMDANPGMSVSAARISREEDRDGREVYAYEVDMEVGGAIMQMNMVHAQDPEDADAYDGRISTRFELGAGGGEPPPPGEEPPPPGEEPPPPGEEPPPPGEEPPPPDGGMGPGPGAGDAHAFSMTYARDEGIHIAVRGASYQPSPEPIDPFDDDGMLDFGTQWAGNATHAIFDIDPETGRTDVSFAWQAGNGDDKARVFNVFVEEHDDGAAGCGFFGYGPRFSAEGPSDNTIATFICNWAGPGNSHQGKEGYAQKQCMQTGETGRFEPTDSQISYAPTNTCETTETDTFAYKLRDEAEFTTDPVSDALIDLASDPDFARFVPPEVPGA